MAWAHFTRKLGLRSLWTRKWKEKSEFHFAERWKLDEFMSCQENTTQKKGARGKMPAPGAINQDTFQSEVRMKIIKLNASSQIPLLDEKLCRRYCRRSVVWIMWKWENFLCTKKVLSRLVMEMRDLFVFCGGCDNGKVDDDESRRRE